MKILAISNSLSGQLTEILNDFTISLSGEIDFVSIKPKKDFFFRGYLISSRYHARNSFGA
jgi:hypothetical protein